MARAFTIIETAMNTQDRVLPSDVMLMAIEVCERTWLVGFTNGSTQLRYELRT